MKPEVCIPVLNTVWFNKYEETIMKYISAKKILLFLVITTIGIAAQPELYSQPKGVITNANIDVEFVPRLAPSEAVYAITNSEGSVDLLISEEAIFLQFSDKGLSNITKEIESETASARNNSHFAEVITNMVKSGVSTLLDRALAIPLYEISEVSYSNGTLIIKSQDGTEIFEEIEVDNKKLMEDFSRRDARRFVGHAERLLD